MKTTSLWAFRGLAATLATGALLVTSVAGAAEEGEGKAGPMMANLRIGPSFGLGAGFGAGFTLAPEFGYAVALENNLYVVAAPQFTFSTLTLITLPVGVQYDYPLPVKNLYVTGRFLAGYTILAGGRGGGGAFTLIPELGAKYVIDKKFNVGMEPISIPVFIGSGRAFEYYRINLYGGLNF